MLTPIWHKVHATYKCVQRRPRPSSTIAIAATAVNLHREGWCNWLFCVCARSRAGHPGGPSGSGPVVHTAIVTAVSTLSEGSLGLAMQMLNI